MARTPTKTTKLMEYAPPSPKSLKSMYDYLKGQHDDLKAEVKIRLKRPLVHSSPNFMSDLILQEEPLHKVYEYFLDINRAKDIPIIVLSDSTVRDDEILTSVGGGCGVGADGGGGGGDGLGGVMDDGECGGV
ncbi:hypothetical protein ACS0TY_006684 [Phlomoides rotata]